ncbi:unnamed protein product, partial [Rotaria magnacalcarata]
ADKFEEQDQANVIILSPDLPTSTISFAISPSLSTLSTPPVASTPLNISTSSSSNPSTTSSSVKDFKAPNSIQEQLIFMAK